MRFHSKKSLQKVLCNVHYESTTRGLKKTFVPKWTFLFCAWLISLDMMSSKFICFVANDMIPYVWESASCYVMSFWHILFIHSPVMALGLIPHLGCLNNATVNLGYHKCLLLLSHRTIKATACTLAFSLWGFSWEAELEDKQSYTGSLICLFTALFSSAIQGY